MLAGRLWSAVLQYPSGPDCFPNENPHRSKRLPPFASGSVMVLGLELPPHDDEILTADQNSPGWRSPSRSVRTQCRQPLGDSSDGRLGRQHGWFADGTHVATLAQLWAEWSKTDLGWRSRCRAARRSRESEPDAGDSRESIRFEVALGYADHSAHADACGSTDDLLVGLQLTHSGRFCRPNSKQLEPRIAYHHPLLDEKFGIDPADDSVVWSDDDLHRLIENYVVAAGVARDVGFQFVDVKACHGYLLHEFLSARTRPGPFGGDFEGRSLLLKTIVSRISDAYPDLSVVVRMSVFDTLPYVTSREVGRPMDWNDEESYVHGFGLNADRSDANGSDGTDRVDSTAYSRWA